jgi:cytoskeletal protein RodZ
MRYKKSHRSLKPFIGVGLLVVLAIAGGTYIVVKHHDDKIALAEKSAPAKPVNTINYGSSTSQDNAGNNQRKSNPSSASQTLDNGTTTSSSLVNTSLSVTITRANSSGTNGTHAITAAANVAGATSGSCTFTATQSGQQTASQTVQVEASNQNYICPPTAISLPASGDWQVSAVFNSGGKSSPSSSWAGGSVSVN